MSRHWLGRLRADIGHRADLTAKGSKAIMGVSDEPQARVATVALAKKSVDRQ
jgi:hypothetical protein